MSEHMGIQIQVIESAPFAENSYIVWQEGAPDAFVIDPGFEPQPILDFIRGRELVLTAILNTHGHVDHIAGNAAMKAAYPDALLMIGSIDAPMLTDPELNLSAKYGFEVLSPPCDVELGDEVSIEVAGIEMDVFVISGHSPGHVVFIVKEGTPPIVFGGDVLFRGGVGRTDFPGGSFTQLERGIQQRLWPLADDTIVFPGHGPPTYIGEEKQCNPFVGKERQRR